MIQPTATIRIDTSYVEDSIGRQYAQNLGDTLRHEFPDWDVQVIPGSVDAVELPIEDMLENFRTERRIRELMTELLMNAVDDYKGD